MSLEEDKFLPFIEGRKGEDFAIIIMPGNYAIFGIILSRIGDHDGQIINEISVRR